jgi:hypothetical protein
MSQTQRLRSKASPAVGIQRDQLPAKLRAITDVALEGTDIDCNYGM